MTEERMLRRSKQDPSYFNVNVVLHATTEQTVPPVRPPTILTESSNMKQCDIDALESLHLFGLGRGDH